MIAVTILVVFPCAMIYAALSDILTMTIPNWLSLALIVTFVAVAPFIGLSWAGFGLHVMVFAAVLAVGLGLFAAGALGGGDAKLMASTALWIGSGMPLITYIMIATLAGGVLTLALIWFRGSPAAVLAGQVPALRRLIDAKGVPYGVALAIAGLTMSGSSPAMIWAISQTI